MRLFIFALASLLSSVARGDSTSPPPPSALVLPTVDSVVPSKCGVSVNGYACGIELAPGLALGYNSPAIDAVTGTGTGVGRRLLQATTAPTLQAGDLVNFVLRSTKSGYVAVGLSKDGGMVPAIAIAGIPNEASTPIRTYIMSSKDDRGVVRVDTSPAAMPIKLLNTAYVYTASSKTHAFYFSLEVGDGPYPIQASGLSKMIFAIGSGTAMVQHSSAGRLDVNFVTGVATLTSQLALLRRAHGVLMMLSFLVLFPLAGIFGTLKRHLTGSRQICGKDAWFQLHRTFVALAVVTMGLGFAIAEWKFEVFESFKPKTSQTHGAFGFAVVATVVLQVIIGLIRPDPDSKKRKIWRGIHRFVGVSVIAILTPVTIFTGCWALGYVNTKQESYKWFAAAAILEAAMLVSFGVAMRVRASRDAAAAQGLDGRIRSGKGSVQPIELSGLGDMGEKLPAHYDPRFQRRPEQFTITAST